MAIVTYRGNEIVTTDASSEYVKEEARINRMPVVELDDFLRQVEYPLNKCLIVGTPEKMPEVEQKVAAATKGRISVYTSAPFFLECVPLHIDKAQSLARLIEKWGITKDEVMACGDGHNDLSMIEFAGMGVAMDNADDVVKQAANYVTLSNEEDGVGVAVEKFVLNR
jgi:Cof subfamily protein (haloacid dehalogenase superfamily)